MKEAGRFLSCFRFSPSCGTYNFCPTILSQRNQAHLLQSSLVVPSGTWKSKRTVLSCNVTEIPYAATRSRRSRWLTRDGGARRQGDGGGDVLKRRFHALFRIPYFCLERLFLCPLTPPLPLQSVEATKFFNPTVQGEGHHGSHKDHKKAGNSSLLCPSIGRGHDPWRSLIWQDFVLTGPAEACKFFIAPEERRCWSSGGFVSVQTVFSKRYVFV